MYPQPYDVIIIRLRARGGVLHMCYWRHRPSIQPSMGLCVAVREREATTPMIVGRNASQLGLTSVGIASLIDDEPTRADAVRVLIDQNP